MIPIVLLLGDVGPEAIPPHVRFFLVYSSMRFWFFDQESFVGKRVCYFFFFFNHRGFLRIFFSSLVFDEYVPGSPKSAKLTAVVYCCMVQTSRMLFCPCYSCLISKTQRGDTCEPGMFEGIVGDLGSSPSSTPASSAGGGDPRIGEDTDTAVPPHATAARPEAASPRAPNPR